MQISPFAIAALCLLMVSSLCVSSPKTLPDYKFFTGISSPTVVKTASNEDMFMVGFKNGSLLSFDMKGNLLNNFKGHDTQIVDIKWFPGWGPLSLDSSGRAIKWTSNGIYMYSVFLGVPTIDMSIVGYSQGTYLVAINVGFQVIQYAFKFNTYSLSKVYYPEGFTNFTRIQYDQQGEYLYVGTDNNQIRSYYTYSGKYASLRVFLNSTIMQFKPASLNFTVFLEKQNKIHRFQSFPFKQVFTPQQMATGFTVCPDSNLLILSVRESNLMYPYSFTGQKQSPNILYNDFFVKDLECSRSYLVSVDNEGYVGIGTYNRPVPPKPQDDSDNWGLYGGLIAGALILIIVIVVVCVRRRKLRNKKEAEQSLINDESPKQTDQNDKKPQQDRAKPEGTQSDFACEPETNQNPYALKSNNSRNDSGVKWKSRT